MLIALYFALLAAGVAGFIRYGLLPTRERLALTHQMADGCRECGDDDWCHRCKATGLIHTPGARTCGHCGGSKKCPYA